MSAHVFQRFLGPDIKQFLAYKRSLGRRYDVEEKTLALLDVYLLNNEIGNFAEITPALVEAFLVSRPRSRPRSYNHLRCNLGRLFSYLVDQGKLSTTPLRSPPRRVRYQRTPFIFDAAAARRLLALTKTFQDKGGTLNRGGTYFALFAVLYGLGLRVGEACRLRIRDVDLERQLLVIREMKFYKSRLVPFGPKLGAVLSQHRRQRQAALADASLDEAPVFSLRAGRSINPCTVSQVFHALVPRLQLKIPPGVSAPRLHDLRHSFAVGALTRWYRQGIDPTTKLLALSTFLGRGGRVQPSLERLLVEVRHGLPRRQPRRSGTLQALRDGRLAAAHGPRDPPAARYAAQQGKSQYVFDLVHRKPRLRHRLAPL